MLFLSLSGKTRARAIVDAIPLQVFHQSTPVEINCGWKEQA